MHEKPQRGRMHERGEGERRFEATNPLHDQRRAGTAVLEEPAAPLISYYDFFGGVRSRSGGGASGSFHLM
jgi:hypothetical protein